MNFEWRPLGGQYLCPACGLPEYFDSRAFDEFGGSIAQGICPCCFFEPGFNDDPSASGDAAATVLESILRHRERWVAEGMPWRRGTIDERRAIGVYDPRRISDDAPKGWCPKEQLEKLLRLAPDLR
jgi:hypothetical protein